MWTLRLYYIDQTDFKHVWNFQNKRNAQIHGLSVVPLQPEQIVTFIECGSVTLSGDAGARQILEVSRVKKVKAEGSRGRGRRGRRNKDG